MSKFQKIGNYVIEFDQTYALCYSGGKRDLPKKDMDEYNKILTLPLHLQAIEKNRMKLWANPEKDPNVVPIKGVILLEYIRDLKIIPIFDNYFVHTKRIFLTDLASYEWIKQKTQNYFNKQ